ncbi:hypothetical protein [Porcipelethomonas sp.]|uniref:hypothetical protein n=1 Tax=Porcipelethomonas sp. TaxID=2981675 RepID=UPI003EFA44AF
MEIITISGIKDTDEFKKNKEAAWKYILGEGDFNIDDFEPAQYKYFDKLLQLYGELHSDAITKEQAKAEDEKNYSELESYVDERLEYIHDRLIISENLKAAYDDIRKIEKSSDMAEMFGFMADAIGKLIDDASFSDRQKRKIKNA